MEVVRIIEASVLVVDTDTLHAVSVFANASVSSFAQVLTSDSKDDGIESSDSVVNAFFNVSSNKVEMVAGDQNTATATGNVVFQSSLSFDADGVLIGASGNANVSASGMTMGSTANSSGGGSVAFTLEFEVPENPSYTYEVIGVVSGQGQFCNGRYRLHYPDGIQDDDFESFDTFSDTNLVSINDTITLVPGEYRVEWHVFCGSGAFGDVTPSQMSSGNFDFDIVFEEIE